MKRQRRWSIASQIFVAQLTAVIAISGGLTVVLWLDARVSADDDAARLSVAVSTTLATDPYVIAAVQSPDPTAQLQPYARRVTDQAGVDFVTIMSPDGTRFTHRDPEQIGGKFLGTIAPALEGTSLTETYTGTLGPSVRAVVPVFSGDDVVAIVSAGVTVDNVVAAVAPRIPFVLGAAALLVVIGSAGAFLARRFLSRVTGTLRPSEVSRMVNYYESVLHSARDGLVLTDANQRVVLYNDEAADLLGLPPVGAAVDGDSSPVAASDLDLPPWLKELILDGRRAVEEPHVAGHRVLVVDQEPATPSGIPGAPVLGTVITVRDRTEVQRLSGELETVRSLTEALRSQTHEHNNRLHTVLTLLELDRAAEAIDFIAQEVEMSQSLADAVVGAIDEPVLAALLLGKAAQARERGVEFRLDAGADLARSSLTASELVSVVGNLIDNAIDAAAGGREPKWVSVSLHRDPESPRLDLTVSDSGRGIDPGMESAIFAQGFTTKAADAAGRGFGLAVVRQVLEGKGGSISVADRGATTFIAHWPALDGRWERDGQPTGVVPSGVVDA